MIYGTVLGVSTVLNTLGMFCNLIVRITLLGKHYHSHFSEEESEPSHGEFSCSKEHRDCSKIDTKPTPN